MDILKCQAFLYSIEYGSFSLAGEKMGYTPSGVVRMINSLENEIGFPILNRTHQGVFLNEDGKKLFPFIKEMVDKYESIMQLSYDIRGLSVGNLTIGTYSSVAISWLPSIIKRFEASYPNININILEGGNNYLMNLLENREADLCLLSKRKSDFDWISLKKDELMVWLPSDHPRASDKFFPLKELNGAPFIRTFPNKDTDNDQLFERENIKVNIKFTTVDNYSTYSMVEAGLGLSVNNKLMTKNWRGNVRVIPINPPQYIELGIALLSKKNASAAAKKFIEYTKIYLEEIED